MSYFETITDAKTFYDNSGICNWEWFVGFEPAAFVDFLYRNIDDYITENADSPNGYDIDFDGLTSEFLIKNGQNPKDYSF